MTFSLDMLRRDLRRFAPPVLAVAFSGLLVATQLGLLVGTFSLVSVPIDRAPADVWVGAPGVATVDVTFPVADDWRDRLRVSGVERVDVYHQNFGWWKKPAGGAELVVVVGGELDDGSLGCLAVLDAGLRSRLAEPGTVVVDESELGRLGVSGAGATAAINGKPVRVVGVVKGLRGLAGPYVLGSLATSRSLLGLPEGRTTYLLVRCDPGTDADRVAAELRDRLGGEASVFTREDFSARSRRHWVVKTGGGVALLCGAVLGLLVGAVVTAQSLYAATLATRREFAVLLSLGVPRWRLAAVVLQHAAAVGLAGVCVAAPAVFGVAAAAARSGASVTLSTGILAGTAAVTLLTALVAGAVALRSLRSVRITTLLR